ncbi:hypothetical protein E7T09_04430 [Deinococcus sp. KSM4-11]|uniref:hypothetical protein n=1 Tax=Deinococcus sp. KSM4-11 TaxID=2568654 RepID=UPI0010A48879|nr:hypothetical protein [Deinococcus sp. KSM4-11]THF88457.1 hypothetical protein E7T09_04430 [Deinococcus sp. KSM4-11]
MLPPQPRVVSHATMPAPHLTPDFTATVSPGARRSFSHVAGEVKANQVRHADLNAFAWFTPGGGWDLRNHRKLRRRGLSGTGDTDDQGRR